MPQSLQCPRCNQAVTVADRAAGKRVKCPHCEETFLAPGFAATDNDDDDWLQLDDKMPVEAADPASRPSPPPGKPRSKVPKQNPDEQSVWDEFSGEPNDFTAGVDKPPPPASAPSAAGSADIFRPRPATASGASKPAPAPVRKTAPTKPTPRKPAPPQADDIQYASEYRVNCPICGSMTYAKAKQAGHTIKCSDCHSPITVPQPPKIRKQPEIDIENAETFRMETPEDRHRPSDPFQKSADELLAAAERVEDEAPEPDFGAPSVKEWASKVFGIFRDPGVLFHWLALSVAASVPAFVILKFFEFLQIALLPAGLFLGGVTVACGFAILQSVANDEERVSDWPVFDVFGWLGQIFVALAAAGLAAVPPYILGQFVFGSGYDLRTVGMTMLSVYLVFPFVLLSMLDMQSAFAPFSPEVARSVTKSDEAWGGFYFSSGLIFFAQFLICVYASTMDSAAGAILGIFSTIAVAFVYFAMIGRLAYSIGQAVNDPPMVNTIDRSVHSDAAER